MAQHSHVESYGKKRPAEGDLEEDQPLAKKFGRLHIDRVTTCHQREGQKDPIPFRPSQSKLDDVMMLDDTKHTIYIHDLEQDIAENEADNNSLTILPGLEDKLSISNFLIADAKPQCNELVLYREPVSLSIPGENDCVRKALLETRERARRRSGDMWSSPPKSAGYDKKSESPSADGLNFVKANTADLMDIDLAPRDSVTYNNNK